MAKMKHGHTLKATVKERSQRNYDYTKLCNICGKPIKSGYICRSCNDFVQKKRTEGRMGKKQSS